MIASFLDRLELIDWIGFVLTAAFVIGIFVVTLAILCLSGRKYRDDK